MILVPYWCKEWLRDRVKLLIINRKEDARLVQSPWLMKYFIEIIFVKGSKYTTFAYLTNS